MRNAASKHFVDIRKSSDGKYRKVVRKSSGLFLYRKAEKYRRATGYHEKHQPVNVEQCFRRDGVTFLCKKCEYHMDLYSCIRSEWGSKKLKEVSKSSFFSSEANTQHRDPNSEHSNQSDKTTAFESATLENENYELANEEAKNEDVEDEIDNVNWLTAKYFFEFLFILFQLYKLAINLKICNYTYES